MSGDLALDLSHFEETHARFNLSGRIAAIGASSDFRALQDAYRHLPVDPYNADVGRHRRLGRGLYLPWKQSFEWLPGETSSTGEEMTAFFQADHNPEHPGSTRHFAALPEAIKANVALRSIIDHATAHPRWSHFEYTRPVVVGVHMVSQRVNQATPVSVVTPRAMHQDGEAYGFVHLIQRRNVEAGWNVVAENAAIGLDPNEVPDRFQLERFCLEEPLDSFCVRDAAVCHGVEPIRLSEGCIAGYRDTLLIDLTPMREIHHA